MSADAWRRRHDRRLRHRPLSQAGAGGGDLVWRRGVPRRPRRHMLGYRRDFHEPTDETTPALNIAELASASARRSASRAGSLSTRSASTPSPTPPRIGSSSTSIPRRPRRRRSARRSRTASSRCRCCRLSPTTRCRRSRGWRWASTTASTRCASSRRCAPARRISRALPGSRRSPSAAPERIAEPQGGDGGDRGRGQAGADRRLVDALHAGRLAAAFARDAPYAVRPEREAAVAVGQRAGALRGVSTMRAASGPWAATSAASSRCSTPSPMTRQLSAKPRSRRRAPPPRRRGRDRRDDLSPASPAPWPPAFGDAEFRRRRR